MRRAIAVLSTLFCAMVLMNGTVAFADTEAPPVPYSIEVEGDKTFYMTPRGDVTENQPQSGLYRNTIPPEPIYTVPVYYDYGALILSRDGSCFAGIPWALQGDSPSKLDGDAISFYNNGALVNRYTVGELLKDVKKARFSASHVAWEEYDKRSFDGATNVLTVKTMDGLVYSFDLATGEIIAVKQEPSPSSIIVPVLLGLGVILVVSVAVVSARTRKPAHR